MAAYILTARRRNSASSLIVLLLLLPPMAALGQELQEFDSDFLQAPADGPKLGEAVDLIVQRSNEFREEEGLESLAVNENLTRAAQYFAAFMARTGEYGHQADGYRPSERAAIFDYNYCIVAENIAFQFKSTDFKTTELAQQFVDGWIESTSHRENMLRPHVTETGVAIGHDPQTNRYYAVQLFGRPQSAAIEFQVTNRTPESIEYAVAASDGDESSRRTFELPPRATMFHTRCRPSRIDWGWSENADGIQPQTGRDYVVTLSASGHRVTEEPANELEVAPTK
jgi:hypothetical protein